MARENAAWNARLEDSYFYAGVSDNYGPMTEAHRHSELEMGYMAQGSVDMAYASEIKPLDSGCLNLFWAIVPHRLVSVKGPTRSYVTRIPLQWLLASPLHCAWCEKLIGEVTVLHLPIPVADQDWVEGYFKRWASDYTRTRTCRDDRERDLLMQLLCSDFQAFLLRILQMTTDLHASEIREPAPWMLTILKAIHGSLETELSVGSLAKRVGLNQQYLSREFKRRVGIGLNDYINQERLRLAKYLIATTTRTITDIAFASGFGNLGWFNELFKAKSGFTPREYRALAAKPEAG